MELQRLNQTKPASVRPTPASEAIQRLEHPVLQLQATHGNCAVNQWLAAQQKTPGIQQPIQAKMFQPLSQELIGKSQQGLPRTQTPGMTTDQGKPLPTPVQQKMERSFNTDFSDVRIHEGPEAEAIGASAYTSGPHIHFAPNKYAPTSLSGQQLLGHELAHVMQQRAGRVATPQGNNLPINDSPSLEAEADALGAKAAQAEPAQLEGAAIQPQVATSSATVVQCWRPFKEARYKLGRNYGIVFGQSGLRGDQERRAARRERRAADSRVNIIPPEEEPVPSAKSVSDLMSNQNPKGKTLPEDTPEDVKRHVEAYNRARFYFGIRYGSTEVNGETIDIPNNIQKEGLLTKYAGTGAADSAVGKGIYVNPEQVKGKVHLGLDRGTSETYAYAGLIRPFLGPQRTQYHRAKKLTSGQKAQPSAFPEQLYMDPDQDKAVTTEVDIPPDQILFGTNEELIEAAEGRDQAAIKILDIIGQHYQDFKPSREEVLENHRKALNLRRLSI